VRPDFINRRLLRYTVTSSFFCYVRTESKFRISFCHSVLTLFCHVAHTFNGNWYMWAGYGNFSEALSTVGKLKFKGMSGHMVTVTSDEEFSFLIGINYTSGYIGASDQDTEGIFRWIAGPDAGVILSTAHWNNGEPNNDLKGEDCVEIEGKWNDIDCSEKRNWFIEFECQSDNALNITCPSMY
jgi:hypothetical protein